jgi:hypothetical protein
LACVKLRSRVLTALNLLPSIATLASLNNSGRRHSTTNARQPAGSLTIVLPKIGYRLESGIIDVFVDELDLIELGFGGVEPDAKAALKVQINKSDRNDAVGIARIMPCGWYKAVVT